jgi:dipeptidyl aminopeptidase/acylaminoacyl peptidase
MSLTAGSFDISATTLDGGSVVPIATTPFDEYDGRFSPDGRWVAYVSDETGRPEVYVQSFPPSGNRWTVSSGGGGEPRWRRDGREIIFQAADGVIMSVAVSASTRFESGVPKRLFAVRTPTFGNPYRMNLEVAGDGQRFLINTATGTIETKPISVMVNWRSALLRKETSK